MCAPVVAGVMLAGAAVGAYSQYRKGQSEAQVAENNAKMAGYQRADALQRGGIEAGRVFGEAREAVASARTEAAAGGVDTSTGSIGNVFTASMMNAGADAARVKSGAAREAWGFKSEQKDLRAQAKENRKAGYLGALGTGLSAVGSTAGAYGSGTK